MPDAATAKRFEGIGFLCIFRKSLFYEKAACGLGTFGFALQQLL